MGRRMRPLRRLLGSLWLRVGLGLGLVAALVVRVGARPILDTLGDVRAGPIVAAVAVLVVAFCVAGLRWRLFLGAVGIALSRPEAVRATFVGAFTTNFLPGSVGGDAARAWLVGPGRRVPGLGTVVVDRLTLFGCSIAFGWLLVPFASVPPVLVAALAAATALAVTLALLATGAIGLGSRVGPRMETRLGARLTVFSASVRTCLRQPPVWLAGTALGLAYQALVVLEVWLLAEALSLGISYPVVAVATPAVLLLSSLPVSVGGIGVREVTYVTVLAPVAVAAPEATSLSLLAGLVFLVASLPGAVELALRGARSRRRSAPRTAPGVASEPS